MDNEKKQSLLGMAEKYFQEGPSHDRVHVMRTIEFARSLHKIYGGDFDLIEVAAIVHDIGRSNPGLHEIDSLRESVRLAEPILRETGLTDDQISRVNQIVLEHDQPHVTPSTVEGKILKDADWLDGFGARGILRTIVWAIESGQGVDGAIYRLKVKMPKRMEALTFPESREFALREYEFVKEFLKRLEGGDDNGEM